ncbi:MAG: hypothetical protein Kow0040_00940 [Thermogutta sp.]
MADEPHVASSLHSADLPDGAAKEKKIIVDEDWKARVEREREELRAKQASHTAASQEDDPPLPPPSVTSLAGILALEAMACLGSLPDPLSGKVHVRLNRARHLIDTIELLRRSTQGNVSSEETAALEEILHELRLGFVQVQSQMATGG